MKRPGCLSGFLYLLAMALIAGGVLGGVFTFRKFFHDIYGNDSFFGVPGAFVYTVEEPGTYMIWNTINGTLDGKVYAGSRNLPGDLTVTVTPAGQSAAPLTLTPVSNMNKAIGGKASVALYKFDAPVAGDYTIAVGGSFATRAFNVGPDITPTIVFFTAGLMGGLFSVIGGFLCLALAIVLHVVRGRSRQLPPKSPTAGPIIESSP